MRLFSKIKGGALQFVLFAGATIAVLLMAFLLIAYTHDFFNKRIDMITQLVLAADYGLHYNLQQSSTLAAANEINYPEQEHISITTQRGFWGIYEKWESLATHQKLHFKKIGLCGSRLAEFPSALYLKDRQRPLIMAGGAKITGDAFLPEKGIRMGNVSGQSYYRDQLLYGRQNSSSSNLPQIDKNLLEQLERLTDPNFQPTGEEVDLDPGLVLKNSFEKPIKVIRGYELRLEGVNLVGNIIIQAAKKITVEANSNIRDLLLLAPEIEIKGSVHGNFQAIATERIAVGKSAVLTYPSALVVYKTENLSVEDIPQQPAALSLAEQSKLSGVLLYLDKSEHENYSSQVFIDYGALVHGEVYCKKNLELRGMVSGQVTTSGFITSENGSIYQNHLFDGIIDISNLPESYSGVLLDSSPSKNVVKWLY